MNLSTFNPKFVDDMINNLASAIETINKEITNIEETYRKLLEEAKVSLSEALEETKSQYAYWLAVRGDSPMPEKKKRTRRSKKAELELPADEMVVDEKATEVPEETSTTTMEAEQTPEFTESVSTETEGSLFGDSATQEEDIPIEKEEDFPEEGVESDDDLPEATVEEEAMKPAAEEEDWPSPDFPEEW